VADEEWRRTGRALQDELVCCSRGAGGEGDERWRWRWRAAAAAAAIAIAAKLTEELLDRVDRRKGRVQERLLLLRLRLRSLGCW
jgi:hypothetical protein